MLVNQGSEIVAALGISTDDESTHADILSTAHSPDDIYKHNIELQNILQIKNVVEIVKKKNLLHLRSFGGVQGVAEALNTDLEKGVPFIPNEEICQPKPSQLSFVVVIIYSVLEACNNYTIFLLSTAAILSLVFGITEDGPQIGWLTGAVLILTILLVIIFTTIRAWWDKRSHEKLANCWQSKVRVVRGGNFQSVRELDLVVGDIAILGKGDLVPADGLLVTDQALEVVDEAGLIITVDQENPFLFYSYRVINGNTRMMVTSTCMDTVWGEMMCQAIMGSGEKCKFENNVNRLANSMHIAGLMMSISVIIMLFVQYKTGKLEGDHKANTPDSKGQGVELKTIMDAIKGIVIGSTKGARPRVLAALMSVTLLGITESMAFVMSIATIIWSRKIQVDYNISIRDDQACVNMACVNTICFEKLGGLKLNEVEIDKFCVGEELISESSVVASNVLEGFCDGIGTLIRIANCESKLVPVISWAESKLGLKMEFLNEQCNRIVTHIGCNPFQECCQIVIEKNGNERYLHCGGPPEDILSLCSHHYDIGGQIQEMDEPKERRLMESIESMLAEEESEVIAFACKRVNDEASIEPNNLVFLGMISLKRLKIEDTKRAIATLREGGIKVVLVSGYDNDIQELSSIGENFGIFNPDSDDLALTADEFRHWSDEQKRDKVEKIRIMGKCLPSDKILLIKCLQEKRQVVALMAQQTADAPALKQADTGITVGSWSSKIARECSEISIWDSGNCFGSLVNVIKEGRSFQENIRKFIQLQLIITVSSSLINFTGIMLLGDAPITVVQLLCLNIVVAFAGGLGLLTGRQSKPLMMALHAKSFCKLITNAMWRNILFQTFYQTSIFVALQHNGCNILGVSKGQVKSMIYNGFFICQLFNKFIAREPEKMNIFRDLFHRNWWFWVAVVLFALCQAEFYVFEVVFGSSPMLNWKLWAVCLLIGTASWLLDLAVKCASILITLCKY